MNSPSLTKAILSLLLLGSNMVLASSVLVSPIRIEFLPGNQIATLQLENKGAETITIQTQLQSWSQQEGQDQLTSTKDLIVFPPIVKIASGKTQLLRVALRRPIDTERELSYRLFIEEVPAAPKPGTVAIAVRQSIPVFVAPKSKVQAKLTANTQNKAGEYLITFNNPSKMHIQVIQWQLLSGDGQQLLEQTGPGYLLPGQSRSVTLKPKSKINGSTLKLIAKTDAGELPLELRL